jgi:membrane protein required for colicin V production
MSWFDLVILGVIAVSAVVGAYRGLIKESVSLATWVLAVWVAIRFSAPFSNVLPDALSSASFSLGELEFRLDNLKVGIAMVVLFILTWIVGAIVQFLLRYLVQVVNFSATDRALGAVFGVLRGGLLVVALVLLAGLTTAPRADFWNDSLLIPPFEQTAVWVLALLPDHVANYFSYAR